MLLAACAGGAVDNRLHGKVVGVKDGDTLELLTPDKRLITIRLAEIDAPEKRQPWGQKAKLALSDLCFGAEVSAQIVTRDRYGRTVARVYRGSTDISAELVREGAVWVYRRYLSDASLLPLEAEARAAGRGLWSLPAHDQVPPWEWRRARAP